MSTFLEHIRTVAIAALILGGSIAILNFYLSFIRMPLLRWRGQPDRWVSGFPLIGSVLLVPAVFYFAMMWSPWLLTSALLLLAIDTGGVIWLLAMLVRERRRSSR